MIKGILFDFNGTLYLDDDINEATWRDTIKDLSEGQIDFDSFYPQFQGIPNARQIKAALEICGKECNDTIIERWSKEKERKYRQYCIDHKRNQLNKGAEELLDYLKDRGYVLNLCTASIIENVEFYFKNVGLDRWFDIKKASYDDGFSIDKEAMYRKCAKNIGIDMKDVLVFEDTDASIRHAINAGCNNVVAIRRPETPNLTQIRQVIDDFTQFDRNLLDILNK